MQKVYQGRELEQIAFPLGGLGAGMFCLQGTGSLGNFSIRNVPDVHFEPNVFSALHIKGEEGMAVSWRGRSRNIRYSAVRAAPLPVPETG